MRATLRLAPLLLLLCAPAQARENQEVDLRDIEIGDALICDTREQVEHFIELYNGDQEAAIRAVNRRENDPRACGVISAAFVRGPRIAGASHGNMAFEIVRILVVGVDSSGGLRAVAPVPYFAAFGTTEYGV